MPIRYLLTLVLVFLTIATAHSRESDMKEIKYRGGVITFFIPKHWVESYEPDGGGMFYEDGPSTGTLRLNLITAKSPKPLMSDAAFIELSSMKISNPTSIERLQSGNAITSWVKHSSENGQQITLYLWRVANPVFPSHMRIADFSYTVLTSLENRATTKSEVQMLTNAIRNATFHSAIAK